MELDSLGTTGLATAGYWWVFGFSAKTGYWWGFGFSAKLGLKKVTVFSANSGYWWVFDFSANYVPVDLSAAGAAFPFSDLNWINQNLSLLFSIILYRFLFWFLLKFTFWLICRFRRWIFLSYVRLCSSQLWHMFSLWLFCCAAISH